MENDNDTPPLINQWDKDAFLIRACGRQDTDKLKYALDLGANVFAEDSTALHIAAMRGFLDGIKIMEGYSNDPVGFIVSGNLKAFRGAASMARMETLQYLMSHEAATPHAASIALCSACDAGHLDIVRYLLDPSKNKNTADVDFQSGRPLLETLESDSADIAQYLLFSTELQKRAALDTNEMDLLVNCCRKGAKKILGFLLENYRFYNHQNISKLSIPLNWKIQKNEVLQMLTDIHHFNELNQVVSKKENHMAGHKTQRI